MSLSTIAAWLPDRSVKLNDAKKRRVLTTLKMTYEGGSLDGKTANFPTRDLERIVVGLHRRNWHFFETYERTIWLNTRNRRTIFRFAGATIKSSKSSWWKRLLAVIGLGSRQTIKV
jgi:hypothetical protein